jgi:hypothetical protein
MDTFRELGNHINDAISLDRLGDAHDTAGNSAGARVAWSHALAILTSYDSIDTKRLRPR